MLESSDRWSSNTKSHPLYKNSINTIVWSTFQSVPAFVTGKPYLLNSLIPPSIYESTIPSRLWMTWRRGNAMIMWVNFIWTSSSNAISYPLTVYNSTHLSIIHTVSLVYFHFKIFFYAVSKYGSFTRSLYMIPLGIRGISALNHVYKLLKSHFLYNTQCCVRSVLFLWQKHVSSKAIFNGNKIEKWRKEEEGG